MQTNRTSLTSKTPEPAPQHGGKRDRAGRKPMPKGNALEAATTIRLSYKQRELLYLLGGCAWVRSVIDTEARKQGLVSASANV